MTDRDMPFTTHLQELRSRLIKSFVGLIAAIALTWTVHEQIFRFLAKPVMKGLAAHGVQSLQALDILEGISVYLKASMVAAIVVAAPWLVWQAASFVAPALRAREKRLFAAATGLITLFFILGVVFSYAIFVPFVVEFLAGFGVESGDLYLAPTIQNTFGMAMFFMIVFGVIFELPLIMMFAGILHMVSPRKFLHYSRHFIVVAFIIGAIFTPPEPVSQTLMAVPLCLLYGLGILMAWAGWQVGGEGGHRRATVTAVVAVTLFTAGILAAAWFWNKPSAVAAVAQPAGTRSVTLDLDDACAARVSGWHPAAGEHVVVIIDKAGGSAVVFQATGGTVLAIPADAAATDTTGAATDTTGAAAGQNLTVDRFLRTNADRTWTATRNGRSTVMVSAGAAEAEKFLAEMVAATGRLCR